MKKHSRIIILALAAVALIASLAALYVHYNLLRDPSYTSFCDVSETVSCEAVLQSRFATMFGVPVAAGGAIWSALVLLLAWRGMGSSDVQTRERIASYKVPKSIDFVEELPRTPSGKVLRRELRDRYWAGHDRSVG